MVDVVPVGSETLIICHWTQGSGRWEQIEVNHSALNGHENHMDVWPPVDDVTAGKNWPEGETLYISGCEFAMVPSPSPSPSGSESSTGTATPAPTDTLPPTGAMEVSLWALCGVGLFTAGLWLRRTSNRAQQRQGTRP